MRLIHEVTGDFSGGDQVRDSILVTGGLGFIGSHIVNALVGEPKHEVFVYDINASNSGSEKVTTMRGDVFDSDRLLKVVRDREVSSIVHMVGLASIPACNENPDLSFQLNVASVQNILEAMRLCDAKRLIFPSTAAVYGATNGPKVDERVDPRPSNVYGCHKLAAELLIRAYAENYGFDATILRIFNVYGDLDKEQGVVSIFIRKTLAGEPLLVNGGGQLRDFVFLNDVVEAFVKSMRNTASYQETINVASGVGLAIREIAEWVQESFPKAEVEYAPPNDEEYSIYADVSRMRNMLACTPIHPRIGIPMFMEKCKLKCMRDKGMPPVASSAK